MAVGADELAGLDASSRGRNLLGGGLDERRLEHEIGRRVEQQHRHFDFAGIGIGQLVGLDQIQEMIGIRCLGAG
jgi:hypothetical protein